MKLEECRRQIDELDAGIVALLNRRATLSRNVGRIKMQAGLPIIDRDREDAVLLRVVKQNCGELDDEALAAAVDQDFLAIGQPAPTGETAFAGLGSVEFRFVA